MIPFFGLRKTQKNSGFTLIEFVVIISIFAIMAGVGLFNFRGFQTDVSLTNLAHDIALTIKRAQSEGTSGLTSDPSDPTLPPIPRGVEFSYSGGSFAKEFTIFDDINRNDSNDDPQGIVDTVRIQTEDYIVGIALGNDPASFSTSIDTNSFHVIFERPFPDVKAFSTPSTTYSEQYAGIVISNQGGSQKKMILISRVGEISVRACDPNSTSLCAIP